MSSLPKDHVHLGRNNSSRRAVVLPVVVCDMLLLLTLEGAEHSVFADRPLPGESRQRNPKHHPIILALSTAFWDAYLRNHADAKAWLDGNGSKSILDEKDRWQRK